MKENGNGNDAVVEIRNDDAGKSETRRRGMRIVFQDVIYTVVNSQNKKEKVSLLQSVAGYFEAGEMSALMGPSGSGKTTLLDVLAGRKTAGEIKGEIQFAGTRPSVMFLRRFTGYVEQFDTLLDILTVREMLLYTAELKRPLSEPFESKAATADELIESLGLGSCRDVRIGNPLARGISGGQAKRVNIGIALITNPRVLFLDEPTSGLDSYTANEVMTVVRGLVSSGITICATIHTPTSYAFGLFDRLLMLLSGRVVYFGERGDMAVQYFRDQLPGARALQENENEAEWIVDLTTRADRDGKAATYADAYEKSDLKAANEAALARLLQAHSSLEPEALKELAVTHATVTPFWWGLLTLVKYRTLRNYCTPDYIGARIGDKVVFAFIILTLYWGIGDDLGPSNLVNIVAVLYMMGAGPAFSAAAYVPAITLERGLFVRERSDGLYRVITYLVAKMVDELVIGTAVSIVFALVIWYGVQLQGSFIYFWLPFLMTQSIGIVLAYFIASVAPNMDVANAALPTYVVTLLFFSGFLIRYQDMPVYWSWYSYINFLRYSWSTMMKNQFEGAPGTQMNGQPILAFYGVAGVDKSLYLFYMLLFFMAFFTLAWLGLAFKKHSNR